MGILIRPGRAEDTDQAYVLMNEQKTTLPYLGGFTARPAVESMCVEGIDNYERFATIKTGTTIFGVNPGTHTSLWVDGMKFVS